MAMIQKTSELMSNKKRQIHLRLQSQTKQKDRPKLTDFLLTNDQMVMIMSKLPKLFSLQPVKNLPKNNKKPSYQVIIGTKAEQIEISEPLKHTSRAAYKKQRYLIQQNQHGQKEEKIQKRKPERVLFKEKLLQDEKNDVKNEQPNTQKANNSQINKNCINFSIKSNSQIQEMKKPQFQSSLPNNEFKNQKSSKQECLNAQDLLTKMQILKKDSKSLAKFQQKKGQVSQVQTQQAQQTFQKQWKILKSLKNHSLIKPFLLPVDQFLDKAKDYYKIIKQPIDLTTIQSKLLKNMYKSPLQFHMDVQKMWMNSFQYNTPLSGMIKITKELKRYYLNLIKVGPRKSLDQKQNKRKRR